MRAVTLVIMLAMIAAGCADNAEPSPAQEVPGSAASPASAPSATVDKAPETASATQPLLTYSGHYRDSDGRVSDHKFPIELKLSPDGSVTGSFEIWVEKRFDDGSGKLLFMSRTFTGTWAMQGKTLQIAAGKGGPMPVIVLPEMNGLTVRLGGSDQDQPASPAQAPGNGKPINKADLEPLLTFRSHYRNSDGRVKDHKFPIELKLAADGSVTGSYESWVEAQHLDGSSRLLFQMCPLVGRWTVPDRELQITPAQACSAPAVVLPEINGVTLRIIRSKM